jgi:primase-like protein/AAA domain-containing protein
VTPRPKPTGTDDDLTVGEFLAARLASGIGEMPERLVELLAERDFAPVLPDVIPEGERDNTMTSIAGTMRRRGMSLAGILGGLRGENQARCRPPLDDSDLRRIANSAMSWQPAATESSWLPKDIKAWLAGDRSPLEPSYLARSDGQAIVYRGRTHSFIGEPETGKSWLAQMLCAERLKAGQHVVYIDFESELDDVGVRVLALGVSEHQLAARFHYIRPEIRMNKEAIADLVVMVSDCAPEALIVDGVEHGLAMWGKDSNLNKDVIDWEATLIRPLAKATPGATVLIDHVTKNAATRGAYPTGAGQKLAGIDGASFSVELVPGTNNYFGKGKVGLAHVLLQKDSRGGGSLRGKQGAGKVVAVMKLASSEDGKEVTYELQAPASCGTGTPDGRTKDWQPTGVMEKVSKLLEGAPKPLNQKAVIEQVGGKEQWVRVAVSNLIKAGYVAIDDELGPHGAHMHRSIKPYRDPALQPPADYVPGGQI